MKSLGTYRIEYDCGVTQSKHLISHDDFVNDIKPNQKLLMLLEFPNSKFASKDDEASLIEIRKMSKKDRESQAYTIKKRLAEEYGSNYFTTESPLYGALLSGILKLPDNQGGDSFCKIIKIEKI